MAQSFYTKNAKGTKAEQRMGFLAFFATFV